MISNHLAHILCPLSVHFCPLCSFSVHVRLSFASSPLLSLCGGLPCTLCFAFRSAIFTASVSFSTLWHPWQTFIKTSKSKHLPASYDNTVTQPFNEEWPRRCQVPSHDTTHWVIGCEVSLYNSAAASNIDFVATGFTAFARTMLLALYALYCNGAGIFM